MDLSEMQKLLNSPSRSRSVMAKKRKRDKEEKEEYEFRPPDFDEKEFLKKEMSDTRTAVLTIIYAVAFGVIAGLITMAAPGLAGVGFAVGVAGMVLLRYIYPMMKVDISTFQKRNWLGNLGTYFFTFLAIWVLLLNVPFSDHADPTVEKVIVWVGAEGAVQGAEYEFVEAQQGYAWVALNESHPVNTLISKAANVSINITAKVADNGNLKSVKIAVGTQDSPYHDMTDEGKQRFGFKIQSGDLGTTAGLMFYISAEDDAGNTYLFFPVSGIPVEA